MPPEPSRSPYPIESQSPAGRSADIAADTHTTANRTQATRVLHLALLLIVINQVIGSNVMHPPKNGAAPLFPYLEHVWVGTAGLVVILLFWIWSAIRPVRETPVSRLLPWFSALRLKELRTDAAAMAREVVAFKPPSDTHDAVASAFHGLGLIIVTIMTVTGFSWYFVLPGTSLARPVMMTHKLVANLMWGYLILHAAIAIFHHLMGSAILSRMFWFRDRRSV